MKTLMNIIYFSFITVLVNSTLSFGMKSEASNTENFRIKLTFDDILDMSNWKEEDFLHAENFTLVETINKKFERFRKAEEQRKNSNTIYYRKYCEYFTQRDFVSKEEIDLVRPLTKNATHCQHEDLILGTTCNQELGGLFQLIKQNRHTCRFCFISLCTAHTKEVKYNEINRISHNKFGVPLCINCERDCKWYGKVFKLNCELDDLLENLGETILLLQEERRQHLLKLQSEAANLNEHAEEFRERATQQQDKTGGSVTFSLVAGTVNASTILSILGGVSMLTPLAVPILPLAIVSGSISGLVTYMGIFDS